jgi:hypothetical protein
MNAKEAKEKVNKLENDHSTSVKLQQESKYITDVDHLYNHFVDQVDKAVEQRKLSTQIVLGENQFSNEVISEAVNKLRGKGFQVHKEVHNAFKTTKLDISWV